MKYNLDQPIRSEIGMLRYQCTVEWRNGSFIVDEPARAGGQDKGPDPYSLLLASVATCTLITLRMYIDRKGWDIPHVSVAVNMFQVKTEDAVKSVIDRDLRIDQPLTDEQRLRLTEIATACPVSRVLEGEIQMRTRTYHQDSSMGHPAYTDGELIIVGHAESAKELVDEKTA